MPQAGLHALIGLGLKQYIPHKKWLLSSVIFGAVLPDADSIVVAFAKFFLSTEDPVATFHRTFSHSIFTILSVYFSFYVVSRYKQSSDIKTIGIGITLGMLSHVGADVFLWFHGLSILWPLSFPPINLWENFQISQLVHNSMLVLEFPFFSLYAYVLIRYAIKYPAGQERLIKPLGIWMKIELVLFAIYLLLAVTKTSGFFTLFGVVYIPSLIAALFFTVLARRNLDLIQ